MAVTEPVKLYTHEEVEAARHHGYQTAELQYSNLIKRLKERIKELEDGNKS